MFGTDISMDLVIQYRLQAASRLLILGVGTFLAKSAGRYTHKVLGKFDMEPPVRLLFVRVVIGSDRIQIPFPQREIRMLKAS